MRGHLFIASVWRRVGREISLYWNWCIHAVHCIEVQNTWCSTWRSYERFNTSLYWCSLCRGLTVYCAQHLPCLSLLEILHPSGFIAKHKLYSVSYIAGNGMEAMQVVQPQKSHSMHFAMQLFLICNISYEVTISCITTTTCGHKFTSNHILLALICASSKRRTTFWSRAQAMCCEGWLQKHVTLLVWRYIDLNLQCLSYNE